MSNWSIILNSPKFGNTSLFTIVFIDLNFAGAFIVDCVYDDASISVFVYDDATVSAFVYDDASVSAFVYDDVSNLYSNYLFKKSIKLLNGCHGN